MASIRLYIEGGGPYDATQRRIRAGFADFLESALGPAARRVHIVMCGANAVKAFGNALRAHPDDVSLLLVDAEGPVTGSPRAHVSAHAKTACPGDELQYHLMVQAFEAWLTADPDALAGFYGRGFRRGSLPRRQNVEGIPKDDLEPKLREATRATQKGEYHKIRHAAPLLERLDAVKVRKRAYHCRRLFETLETKLSELP